MKEITDKLFEMQDCEYRLFQCALMPTVDREAVIGVRTPALRKYSKELIPEIADAFMKELPHRYYEENNLHAFLIERIKDIDECYKCIEAFLPYIDNWATCDSFSPKVLSKDKDRLLESIDRWMQSGRTYTVRFGMEMLMRYFLDGGYKREYAEKVACVDSDEYYVKMMQAWYFATALAKQYDSAVAFFEEGRLSPWVHNKAITKACESFRVERKHKEYLKSLKRKTAE
ncbi:MAG: DNA alkylation repair protein [Clostridia bacterium]|nr:DNA alkylation repair protein [Clostridia bacterium]